MRETLTFVRHPESGGYLVASDGGLRYYDGQYIWDENARAGLSSGAVWFLVRDGDGDFWLGAGENLYRFRPGQRARAVASGRYFSGAISGDWLYLTGEPQRVTDTPILRLSVSKTKREGSATVTPVSGVRTRGLVSVDSGGWLWFPCGTGICAAIERAEGFEVHRYGTAHGLPSLTWLHAGRDHTGAVWAQTSESPSPKGYLFGLTFHTGPQDRVFRQIDAGVPGLTFCSDPIRTLATTGSEFLEYRPTGVSVWPVDRLRPRMPWRIRQADCLGPDAVIHGFQVGTRRWIRRGGPTFWGKDDGLADPMFGIMRLSPREVVAKPWRRELLWRRLSPDGQRWLPAPGSDERRADLTPIPTSRLRDEAPRRLRYTTVRHGDQTMANLPWLVPDQVRLIQVPDEVLPRAVVMDSYNHLWFASRSGLYSVDLKGKWKHWTASDGLKISALQALGMAPDGTLWIGYDSPVGFSRLKPSASLSEFGAIEHFATQTHTYRDSTMAFGFTRSGHVWRGTGDGVEIFHPTRTDLADRIRIGVADGLIDGDVGMDGIWRDPADDSMWVCTLTGITRFSRPEEMLDEATAQIGPYSAGVGTDRRARFHLAVSPAFAARSTRLEYRLLPLQKDWHPNSTLEIVTDPLPEGQTYTLEARLGGESRNAIVPQVFRQSIAIPGSSVFGSNWRVSVFFLVGSLAGALAIRRSRARRAWGELRQRFEELRALPANERAEALRALPDGHRPQLEAMLANVDNPLPALAGPAPPDATGIIVGGRFLAEHRIAAGGFSTVYFGHDDSGQSVAIKIMRHRDEVGTDARRYWERECQLLGQLRHSNIVRWHGSGADPTHGLYIVTEYVRGVTLRSLLKLEGRMASARVLARARQLADALTYAHSRHVLHCDIKPDNIMLRDVGGSREAAVLIDFGIATLRQSDMTFAETTRLAGAMQYIAPEQLRQRVGEATDVFGLAVTVFEMLTGVAWRRAQGSGAIAELLPADDLRNVFEEACREDPSERTPTAQSFVDAFERAIRSRSE